MSEHHYFATCAFGWATADDRETAIRNLINRFRRDITQVTNNTRKEGNPGMYLWSCKVLARSDAEYSIEFYQPTGVEWTDSQEHAVTYVTAKAEAWCQTYEAEARLLRRKLEAIEEENAA